MNEFIVWDKDNYLGEDNKFHELDRFFDEGFSVTLEKDKGLVIVDFDRNDEHYSDILNVETFEYVGKTDINNEKIYVESSIFEFDIVEFNIADEETGARNTYNGYFKYDKDILSYVVFFDRGGKFLDRIVYCPSRIQNIKIVDTIQENKLGLIK